MFDLKNNVEVFKIMFRNANRTNRKGVSPAIAVKLVKSIRVAHVLRKQIGFFLSGHFLTVLRKTQAVVDFLFFPFPSSTLILRVYCCF